jgi:hypothetical protein
MAVCSIPVEQGKRDLHLNLTSLKQGIYPTPVNMDFLGESVCWWWGRGWGEHAYVLRATKASKYQPGQEVSSCLLMGHSPRLRSGV